GRSGEARQAARVAAPARSPHPVHFHARIPSRQTSLVSHAVPCYTFGPGSRRTARDEAGRPDLGGRLEMASMPHPVTSAPGGSRLGSENANARRLRWQHSPSVHVCLPASAWEKDNARLLRRLTLALVAVGFAWRFIHYLLRFPVWGDEAMLLVNYFTKGYLD